VNRANGRTAFAQPLGRRRVRDGSVDRGCSCKAPQETPRLARRSMGGRGEPLCSSPSAARSFAAKRTY
jgi:hypothetical protein